MNSPNKFKDQAHIPSFMVFSKKSSQKSLDRDIQPDPSKKQHESVTWSNPINYSQDAYASVTNINVNQAYNTKVETKKNYHQYLNRSEIVDSQDNYNTAKVRDEALVYADGQNNSYVSSPAKIMFVENSS